MTKDYKHYILEEIRTELTNLDWVEFPDLTREFLGNFTKLSAHIEYPEYLFCEFPNGWQLILGFGDSSPDMWDGVLYWQLQRDYETTDYHAGQMNNGSPRFILWCLFEELEEQLKGAKNA
jgi:hypothetical protein